mgnify:CR=1 FL=1
MTPLKETLTIQQGRTFRLPVRWESDEFAYAAISAIPQQAPCRITAANHGIPDKWRAAVVSVKGMVEINAELDEATKLPLDKAYRRVKRISTDQVEFNDLNAADFSAYVSGGYLQYRVPHPLTGYTARMSIKDKVGGTELLPLTVANGRISIDETNFVVNLYISAADTALMTKGGVYDLEMVAPGGDVFVIMTGGVSVVKEVTTL